MPEPNGGDNGPDEESGAEARQAEAPKPRHQALTSALAVMAALAALASCLLNGSSALALAVPVIFCGAGLFLFPPRGRVHGVVLLCVLLGLAFAALSLLPATLAGRPPAWRTNLVENWGFILPATISAQPFLTQGALITVSVACCWFFWLAGMRLPAGSRRHALRTVALGIMTIAALSLAEHFGWIKLGWPLGGERPPVHMGPFINRNYLSSICAVGCVLFAALAHDAHLNRSLSWLGYAVAVLVPFAAIVINTSRGGLLLFCLGIVLWVATSGMRKGFFRKLAVNASLIFCGAAVLMVFGGGAGAKLMEQGIDRELSSEGARVSIYEQTLSLAAGSPLAGIGLGNFDSVFSLHHTLPALTDRITHPESDWLWWMSEAGIPALVCALVAGLWLVQAGIGRRRSRDASHSTRLDQRLRNAAGIAFALALIHGLFDTPLHNAGYALLVLLLGACAVSPRRQRTDSGLATRLAFRLLGLAVLAVGVAHASTALGRPVLPGRPAMRHQRQVIDDLMSLEKPQEALARLNQLILLAPLQWDLYYRRGLLRLALNHGSSGALADFGRARVLEPNNATICLEEGNLWLRHDPALAIIPWREFVRRRNDSWSYSYVLGLSRDYPALVQSFRQLATTPSMKASYLLHVQHTGQWQEALADLLALDPHLEQIDLSQRQQIIQSWQARGDRDALLNALENHPEWHADSWPVLADEYAQRAEFEKAWEVQKKHVQATYPQEVSSHLQIDQLERNFAFNPADARAGIELYFAQKRLGKQEDAGRTLDKLLDLPNAPGFLHMEKAARFAEQQDFRRAYETMKAALASQAK